MCENEFVVFENLIDELSDSEEYDKVDKLLDNKIVDLQQKEVSANIAQSYLELYASLAGDMESLSRYEKLSEIFINQNLVTSEMVENVIKDSPSNRWF